MGAWASAFRRIATACAVFAVVSAPAPVRAQDRPLADLLRPGDTIDVTTTTGTRLKGRFVTLTGDALTLQSDGEARHVRLADVDRVRRTRMGFLLGTVIGAGIGAGLGAAAASLAENEAGNGTTAFLTIFGIGIAAGAGIDALVNLPRTVYDRGRRVSVAPIVAPKAVGVGVRVTF